MATRTIVRHVSRSSQAMAECSARRKKLQKMSTSRSIHCMLELLHFAHLVDNKKEQEKLEKLARKGPKPEETTTTSSGGAGSISDTKPSGQPLQHLKRRLINTETMLS
ncbi:uncharacterized protein Fot_17748 [Forsythia ovata]|uniref:Uncharacterized protein n=1 Tax=Forsythia ovata TaxID=205694 RepID=A0ABD1VG83_9LAMI